MNNSLTRQARFSRHLIGETGGLYCASFLFQAVVFAELRDEPKALNALTMANANSSDISEWRTKLRPVIVKYLQTLARLLDKEDDDWTDALSDFRHEYVQRWRLKAGLDLPTIVRCYKGWDSARKYGGESQTEDSVERDLVDMLYCYQSDIGQFFKQPTWPMEERRITKR